MSGEFILHDAVSGLRRIDQKPVADCIRTWSHPDETELDCFGGSGQTSIAAEMQGCRLGRSSGRFLSGCVSIESCTLRQGADFRIERSEAFAFPETRVRSLREMSNNEQRVWLRDRPGLSPPVGLIAGRSDDMSSEWDHRRALSFTEGHEEDLRELVEIWLTQLPRLIRSMEEGLDGNDPRKVELAAHTLRGSLQIISSGDILDLTADLESSAKTNRLDAARPLLDQLRPRLSHLERDVREYLATG